MAIGGVLTAMVTPFDADGRVDEEAAVRLMRHLLDNGSDGLVVAATTGEAPTLSDDEKLRLFELAVGEFGDETFVVAGTGSNDTAHSVELTERASAVGVDATLAVCPYYNKPDRRGLIAHYRAIAAATDKPVIVYNIPSRCVIDMDNDLLRELGQIENVAAVKQARYENLETIDGLDLLAGNDDVLARVMDVGGTGGILVTSHLIGREMRRMIDEPDARHELHETYADLFKAMFITSSPMPMKAALNMIGLEVGGLRLPLVELGEEERAVVRGALERYGLLSAV
jgi:4-hydroxy-tetrahydrodipicolinate synthase